MEDYRTVCLYRLQSGTYEIAPVLLKERLEASTRLRMRGSFPEDGSDDVLEASGIRGRQIFRFLVEQGTDERTVAASLQEAQDIVVAIRTRFSRPDKTFEQALKPVILPIKNISRVDDTVQGGMEHVFEQASP